MTDIHLLVDAKNTLGEGPLWDVDEQRLYWLDSMNSKVFRCTADGGEIEQWDVPSPIGSLALRQQGGALLALESGFHLFDFKSGKAERLSNPEDGLAHVRLNDGKVDRLGRFIVGSLDMAMFSPDPPARPRGSLYRLDTDFSLKKLDSDIGVSNGPCWSPDDKVFYFADTWANKIWAYDWDAKTGTQSNRRDFIETGKAAGMPDGATVDAEGYYWNAWNGTGVGHGDVRRYAPDGTLDRRIELPSLKVTSLIFGGPNLDILYVTSMAMSGFPEDRLVDGAVFAIHGLGVRGLPEPRFGG
ncbi:MAG: calcium-binding protein [Rhodospirillales bacterium]|nr:calcium-binding protein [Rhodospirillales bacterium]